MFLVVLSHHFWQTSQPWITGPFSKHAIWRNSSAIGRPHLPFILECVSQSSCGTYTTREAISYISNKFIRWKCRIVRKFIVQKMCQFRGPTNSAFKFWSKTRLKVYIWVWLESSCDWIWMWIYSWSFCWANYNQKEYWLVYEVFCNWPSNWKTGNVEEEWKMNLVG